MDKNIVLIGMPGCGKTTVGKILAKKLGMKFVDIDRNIVKSENMTIPEIFRLHGETYFRQAEHREIKKAMEQTGRVIATGGGSVTIPENYVPLHQNSLVFFLDRDINKLSVKGRPVSQRDGVQALYKKRKPLYLSWKTRGCHIRCPNSPNRTAWLIIHKLEAMDRAKQKSDLLP